MVQCLFCLSSTAGLRRSFRLSRKEKENSPIEAKQAEQADAAELLTYEEVTKYQQQPGEQQRLIVLIGKRGIDPEYHLPLSLFAFTPKAFYFLL